MKRLIIFVVSIMFSFGILLAQNTAYIEQVGNDNIAEQNQTGSGNDASIKQLAPWGIPTVGSVGAEAYQTQNGTNNTAIIEQFTDDGVGGSVSTQIQMNGTGNIARANVLQYNNTTYQEQRDGNSNRAYIFTAGGINQDARQIQIGNRNWANIDRQGHFGTYGATWPWYSENYAQQYQQGDDNSALLAQNGNDNTAEQSQFGSNNWSGEQWFPQGLFGIYQEGDDNEAYVTQNDDWNYSKVYQYGDFNDATVIQNGAIGGSAVVNTSTITQNGDNNVANVTQTYQ